MVTDVDGMVCVNPGNPSAMLSTTTSKIIPATSLMRGGIRGRKLPRGSDELGNLELSEHGAGEANSLPIPQGVKQGKVVGSRNQGCVCPHTRNQCLWSADSGVASPVFLPVRGLTTLTATKPELCTFPLEIGKQCSIAFLMGLTNFIAI